MIEDVEVIGDGNAGLLEITNSSHDVSVLHVARRVIIVSGNQDTVVFPLRALD
jgi:hypothetical protein